MKNFSALVGVHQPFLSPPVAVVECSPQISGAGCADGLAAQQSPTTSKEL